MNKTVIIAIVCIIIAGAGGFFGGMQYQKSKAPSFGGFGGNGQFRQRFGQGGQNAAFRPVRGQVISADATSLTVKMPDGSSRIVVLSGSTQFVKSTSGAKSDIKTGDTVMVIGTSNSDGSVTAQDVQINPPAMQRGGMMPTATPTAGY